MTRVVEIDRGLAIKPTAPEAPHFHNRADSLDRDVVVRRLEREGAYRSGPGLGCDTGACENDENKMNHSKNWIAAAEIHQT